MAKQKPKAKGSRKRSEGQSTAQESKPNLFERLYNRKKFDILGKKAKGERKHGQSVHDAVDKRKKTLLVEYRQLRKANAFVDRRFGEEDESLTAEEKAIARFQKQRMKEFGGDKFSLNDDQEGGGELLTHMGRSLGAGDTHEGFSFQDDDADDHLNQQMTEQFNFGGGLFEKKIDSADPDADPDRHRSKKEVMEEVMAKSKKFKAEKQHQREEDLNETEALDSKFKELMEGRLMAGMVRPKGEKGNAVKGRSEDPEGAAFDIMRRELVFDAKAKVGERTKTAEELAAEEQQRLERLEAQRLKRLRGTSGDDLGEGASTSEEEDGLTGLGGFAARRAKRRRREAQAADKDNLNDDDPLGSGEEDEEEGSEEEDGDDSADGGMPDSDEEEGGRLLKATLETRQAARAAGDHPLQQSFRAAAAQLLEKYGTAAGTKKKNSKKAKLADSPQEEAELAAEAAANEDREEAAQDSEEGSMVPTSEAEEDSADQEASSADSASDEDDHTSASGHSGDSEPVGTDSDSDLDSDSQAAAAEPASHQSSERQKAHAEAQGSGHPHDGIPEERDDIPFSITAPSSYAAFAQLVQGHSPSKLRLIIQRIRVCNAIALATDNRRKLQVFYGILVQHFAILAGASPVSMQALDVLTVHILELTAEVPYYAATVARARLGRAHKRLSAALTSLDSSEGGGWPGARDVLVLKLWATVFPVSDRRHPVTTPLALLTSSYLALCPVTCHRDAAVGLLLSSLALHMAAPGGRLVPEPLTFASALLSTAMPQPATAVAHTQQWLLPSEGWASLSGAAPPLNLAEVLQSSSDDVRFQPDSFRGSLLQAALGVVSRASEVFAKLLSFPELFAPAAQALNGLGTAEDLPQDLQEAVLQLHSSLGEKSSEHILQRRPLVRKAAVRVADVKQYNPQFEEEYVAGKDYDPDRERAEQKRLKRQLNKERRGAMRELRKDAVFLSDEKDKEKAQAKAERAGAFQKNMSFLQQQESDFKSGGQGGMWKKGKGKGKR
ncbi:TPA: hypothetical protein ACH3X2_004286 [Trebouxia sp. C0005]